MPVDLYTKTVLTVIAVCLMWLCVNSVMPVASAQGGPVRPTPVLIVDQNGNPAVTAQGLRVNVGSMPVPVLIENPSLSVVLTSIQRRGNWDPIQVDPVRGPATALPQP